MVGSGYTTEVVPLAVGAGGDTTNQITTKGNGVLQ